MLLDTTIAYVTCLDSVQVHQVADTVQAHQVDKVTKMTDLLLVS